MDMDKTVFMTVTAIAATNLTTFNGNVERVTVLAACGEETVTIEVPTSDAPRVGELIQVKVSW